MRHGMARPHRNAKAVGETLRERHRPDRLGPVHGKHEVVPDRLRKRLSDSGDLSHVGQALARGARHDAKPVLRWNAETAVEQRRRASVRGPHPQAGRDRDHAGPARDLRREVPRQVRFPGRCGEPGPVALGLAAAPEAQPARARAHREKLAATEDDQFTVGGDHFDTQLVCQARRERWRAVRVRSTGAAGHQPHVVRPTAKTARQHTAEVGQHTGVKSVQGRISRLVHHNCPAVILGGNLFREREARIPGPAGANQHRRARPLYHDRSHPQHTSAPTPSLVPRLPSPGSSPIRQGLPLRERRPVGFRDRPPVHPNRSGAPASSAPPERGRGAFPPGRCGSETGRAKATIRSGFRMRICRSH